MPGTPLDLKNDVLTRVRADPPRKVWTPSDFLDLGSRDAVDKTLQRLTRAGDLRRIDRGLYDRPASNPLTQKSTPPDPRSVIEALGRRDQVRMLVDGITAANDLGLTDAVPAKIVVHSDARRRALRLGNVTITFKPTAASKLFWADRPGMRVVQALHWMRDLFDRDGEADRTRHKLRKLLDDPVTGATLRADLIAGLTTLPTWMQVFLKEVLVHSGRPPSSTAGDNHHDDHYDDQESDLRQRDASADDWQDRVGAARPARRSASPAKSRVPNA